MAKIGIFFGTDSGTTRLMAKKMARHLGDIASKPLNVNRIEIGDLLQYDSLILGTPTYAEGQLPGLSTNVKDGSWEEFLPLLAKEDLSGKCIAIYGLGDQVKYTASFSDSLFYLYDAITKAGAEIIGAWPTDGYEFESSKSVVDGQFVGLIIDQLNQPLLTEEKISTWLDMIKPALLKNITSSQTQAV